MSLETVYVASEIANSQVVWSILCILLAGYILWHSNKRETRLLDNLSELTKAQQEQAKAFGVCRGVFPRRTDSHEFAFCL